MTTKTTARFVAAAVTVSALVPLFAFAQGVTMPASVTEAMAPRTRAAVTASTTADTARATRAKEKAVKEIDRRIESLGALLTRVEAMNKVTDALKNNLKINVQTEIDGFNALKTKIEADTDVPTLKTDIKSITDSYRIYMLVIPQGRIAAAADKMATIINMMASVGTKLQARVNAAKAAGNDTAAAEKLLTDLSSKLTSAQTHAQDAVNVSAPLVPDNGDKTVMASNDAALKSAHENIKGGNADLQAARKDIDGIIKALKGMKAATSTPSTTGSSTTQQ